MQATSKRLVLLCLCIIVWSILLESQTAKKATATEKKTPLAATSSDLSKESTLYAVGYAHLDTQWRWEYPQSINEFLPRTMHDNFALFEKYPHYIFNFSGANLYRM